MNLAHTIESTEKKYLQILEEFFTEKWGKTLLYSHDINHHRRVWHFAKELLEAVRLKKEIHKSELSCKLLIACYMHDLGMSVDLEIRHGIRSRELCKLFLLNNYIEVSDITDILDAVEYHDDKEYKTHGFNSNEILKILTVADDLDAFGYIGIYRYLEIYLARSIRKEDIGYEIRKNAFLRYLNFESTFKACSGLIERHKKRYLIIDEFFSSYNNQIENNHKFHQGNRYQINTVEAIIDAIKANIPPEEIRNTCQKISSYPALGKFIDQFSSELNEFQR